MKLKPIILGSLIAIGIAGYFYAQNTENTEQVYYITEPVARMTLDKSVLATGSVRASQRTEVGLRYQVKLSH